MIDLNTMSLAELEAHKVEVEKLIKQHHDFRKSELIDALLSAARALKKEYPYMSADIEVSCGECDSLIDVDILDYLVDMSARQFHS
jgi:hypothetical protein